MAITDHDTVKGAMELLSIQSSSMKMIPGIELSSFFEEEPQIHLTGYFPPTADLSKFQTQIGEHTLRVRLFPLYCVD